MVTGVGKLPWVHPLAGTDLEGGSRPRAQFELLRADGCRRGSQALQFLGIALWILERECSLGGSVHGDQTLSVATPSLCWGDDEME